MGCAHCKEARYIKIICYQKYAFKIANFLKKFDINNA